MNDAYKFRDRFAVVEKFSLGSKKFSRRVVRLVDKPERGEVQVRKTLINVGMALAFGVTTLSAQAAVVNTGDILSITNGVPGTNANGSPIVTGGSWFAMDLNGNSSIGATERTPITMGSKGIVIGVNQPVGEIDTWTFNGSTGRDYTPTTAITGSTTTGLNMSGWVVNWGGSDIPMPSGAWNPTNCATVGVPCSNTSGVGTFTWDGVSGHAYTLNYAATVPTGSFSGTKYYLHLEGNVSTVPVPAAVWLLGSGLMGLVGVARRRSTTESTTEI